MFEAFISYHAKDRSIADYLQAAIREAGKSRGRRTLRLFWDDTSESAAPDFWLGLGRVLARCKFFILLASPEAAASSWVNEQLKHWLKHKSIDTVLIGITAGELAWNETIGDFVAGVSNPLPPALRAQFRTKPKIVDLRAYRAGADPHDPAFTERASEFAKAINGTLGPSHPKQSREFLHGRTAGARSEPVEDNIEAVSERLSQAYDGLALRDVRIMQLEAELSVIRRQLERRLLEDTERPDPMLPGLQEMPNEFEAAFRDRVACSIEPPINDVVEFGVSHPTYAARDAPFTIDAWFYRQEDRHLATERALELGPENDRFRSAGSTQVARGTKLIVELELPWPVEPAVQTVHWNGMVTNVSFRVVPTNELQAGKAFGACKISIDGLRVGHVFFEIAFGTKKPQTVVSNWPGRIRSAFASYASQDRKRVLARVQGIEKLGVKVFMDVHNLRSNDCYQEHLFTAIDGSDVLYLFWSSHAKRSTWVEREWRYGLLKRGIDFIDPVPLVDPREVPPPQELASHKHFNDWTLAYLAYEKSVTQCTGDLD